MRRELSALTLQLKWLLAIMCFTAVSVYQTRAQDNNFYSTQQDPPGEELEITRGGTQKITFRAKWEDNKGEEYQLYAGLNQTIFTVPGTKNGLLTVIYNGCTSSDSPQQRCQEAQVTFRGVEEINGAFITFSLWYSVDSSWKELSRVKIILTDQDATETEPDGSHSPEKNKAYQSHPQTIIISVCTVLVIFIITVWPNYTMNFHSFLPRGFVFVC